MTAVTQSFTTRVPPWQRVGTVIDDDSVTSAEAARLGGLDFDVVVRYAGFANKENKWEVASGKRAIVREDTDEFFAFVSPTYTPVQYSDAFAFLDKINPKFVAAGTFNGGRQGFMVVQFPQVESLDIEINGEVDHHDLFAVCQTSHDLSKGIQVACLPLRHRCMNQLPFTSLMRGAPQRWSATHVGDPMRKLAVARDTYLHFTKYVEVFHNTVRQLSSVRVNEEELTQVLKLVLPDKPKRGEQITSIMAAFRESPTVGFAGTGWAGVNAVSDYFEHGRNGGARTPQSRFTDGLAGETRKHVNRTAQLLLSR